MPNNDMAATDQISGEVRIDGDRCNGIIDAVADVVVGQRPLLKKLLAGALSGGHVLFEDYPGLGKTLLAKTFARVIGSDYTRIQFTPDLLPADILGTSVWRQNEGTFEFVKGPIFASVLLADEINRAPPRTQSALLEAMGEFQVTIEGVKYALEPPFLVMATQNPIEQEGTYPLPEAQTDRFMFKLSMGYPRSLSEEIEILSRRLNWKKDDPTADVEPAVSLQEFIALQEDVERLVYIDPVMLDYIASVIRATREHPDIEIGSSPRGGLALLKASRAMALINGRDYVIPDDVKALAVETLAHRVILHPEVILEGTKESEVIDQAVQGVPIPTELARSSRDGRRTVSPDQPESEGTEM